MLDLFKHKNNVALLTEDSSLFLSYQDLLDFSSEIREVIPSRSFGIILCSNSIGAIAAYVSCLQNRVVPLLLPSDISVDLLNNYVSIYRPSFLWMPDKLSIYDNLQIQFHKYGYVLKKLNRFSSDSNTPELYKELALLLTTSGSTGSPKLVRLSYLNIQSNALSISEYLELTSAERPITSLPMHYSYGLSVINSHLLVGATILLTDRSIFDRAFWSFLKTQNATSISGVPYMYEMLDKLRFFRMDLPYLKTLTQAGGKLSKDLQLKFAEYASKENKKFFVMYGQSEATARISFLPYNRCLEKVGSVGIAVPGGRVRIVDENHDNSSVGELVYRGENVSLGYASNYEDLSKGDDNHGELFTGDIARIDDEGYIYVVGRKKRFLKIFGNRVNLDEIESLIKTQFSGIECACTGKDDQMLIYLTDKTYCDDIKSFIAKITRLNFSAFNIILTDKIPVSESGKILYSMLGV